MAGGRVFHLLKLWLLSLRGCRIVFAHGARPFSRTHISMPRPLRFSKVGWSPCLCDTDETSLLLFSVATQASKESAGPLRAHASTVRVKKTKPKGFFISTPAGLDKDPGNLGQEGTEGFPTCVLSSPQPCGTWTPDTIPFPCLLPCPV